MPEPSSRPPSTVLGLRVSALTAAELVATVIGWTKTRVTHVAVGVNAHVCNLAAADPHFRKHLVAADLCYADGQAVVWAGRLLGNPLPERIATTDLIYPLAEACAEAGKRMYLYGAAPGVAERAAEMLQERTPGLSVATHHGFTTEEQMAELIADIRGHKTDILLVGLGDPLQQNWITAHREEVAVPAILSCGGLFDWTSGSHHRAPSWMIAAGLEWLWRLVLEPRRLAARYLLGNPKFVGHVVAALIRGRHR